MCTHLLKFFHSWYDNPELQGLPKKFCNSVYTSGKINKKCVQFFFFFWVFNSEYPAGNVVWYSDVHFKQWAVTEFLVAEKQSVMRIHKWLKNIYGVNAVHKGTVLSLGFIKHRF